MPMGSGAFVDAMGASWQSTAARLAYSPPFILETAVESEHHVSFQHMVDSAGRLMRQDRQGFALAVLFLHAGQLCLARRIVAEE